MNENGDSPIESTACVRCGTWCDGTDNFCRHCGLALQELRLPSVRDEPQVPALRGSPLPIVARGAAVVAAGTLAEVLVRGLFRAFLGLRRRPPPAPARPSHGKVVRTDERMPDDTHLISETFFLRRVRIRR